MEFSYTGGGGGVMKGERGEGERVWGRGGRRNGGGE